MTRSFYWYQDIHLCDHVNTLTKIWENKNSMKLQIRRGFLLKTEDLTHNYPLLVCEHVFGIFFREQPTGIPLHGSEEGDF